MDVLSELRSRISLNNFQLKVIAVVSMLIDHTADAIPWFRAASVRPLYLLMRCVGRLAFPLFAFLIAEGAVKTRNIWKYALRLAVFAVICEIPFDLKGEGRLFYWGHQNTLFTLLLGLLAIIGFRWLTEEKRKARRGKTAYLAGFLWMAACVVLGQFIKADFRAPGVLLVIGFYFWRTEMESSDVFAVFLMLAMGVAWRTNMLQLFSLLAFIPIFLYNNQLGRKVPRYTFYVVYLAHLLILGGLRLLMK
ncbi:MAG: hypothetical protein J5493_03170 [Lachnospiraceae bacterium]|nr:hypothetical protein [Lachnospiraceae bacterium]